jgi:hypothetical protein
VTSRITGWVIQTIVLLVVLLFGIGSVAMGVKCTISRTVYLDRGPAHSGLHGTTVARDRTRLYGPGVILLGLSTIAAAVAFPFVPLHRPGTRRGQRSQFPLYWQIIGYCTLAGFCCVMIAVVFSIR